MAAEAPLAGLVLAGGRSQRMQRDKAALEFAGETQLARAVRLVAGYASRTFVSVRPDQRDDPERRRFPQIVDRLAEVGPAAGILAAQEALPDHAWLVVAVDLPLLDAATLEQLLGARDPAALATAYRSAADGLPEPLCAVWEPASREPLAAFVAGGRSCPRKFLLTHAARLVELASPEALANVNTPADYAAALARGTGGAP
ncbi:MAG TPA: NTP transferase domain-containing protein [Steroidobacteraceae bacterium]|nr:NTP transferase domain-containing protein [Steroidobacteraceae bacterium]